MNNYLDETTMDLEQLRKEHSRVLSEWYQESEALHTKLEQLQDDKERLVDALVTLSLYVSAGMGDENTTAQDYVERIKDGIVHLAAGFHS